MSPGGRREPRGTKDDSALIEGLVAEGMSERDAEEYLRILKSGSARSSRGRELGRLVAAGMVILSGDGEGYIPVHPRLAVANGYRVWREQKVREINERRMRVDRLILELIPLYEAATEKRATSGGGKGT